MSYGMSKAGINVIAGIDVDKACQETYTANNPSSKFLLKDVGAYPVEHLAVDVGIQKNDDNLLFIGCSPCQYWSLLNSDKTKSKKTAFLLEHFQGFVDHYRPGYVVIENVPGIFKKAESPLDSFRKALKEWGYKVDEGIINANDFEVPQNRKRFVLVACRHSDVALPVPSLKKKLSVADVIGEKNKFPALAPGEEYPRIKWHMAANLSETNRKRLAMTPKNGGTRHAWKKQKSLQLATYKGRDDQFRDVYGRMFWDRPAPTITTKFISISNGRFAHPEEDRGISVREGACLQSFPRSYVIKAKGILEAARLIGNAVPPKLAEAIGRSVFGGKNGRD